MSISTTIRKAGPYPGNGVAVSFPFGFKVFSVDDVLVVRADLSTGVEITLVRGTHYSVSLNSDQDNSPGGSIVLLGGPLSTAYSLTLASQVASTQPAVFTNLGRFYPRVLNDALDRLTILVQQVSERVGRALRVSVSTPAGFNSELPAPVPYGVLAFNRDANGFVTTDPAGASALAGDLASTDTAKGAELIGASDGLGGLLFTTVAGFIGRILARLTGRVSILEFGADPTGVADSLAAINAAISFLGPRKGVVIVPPGRFKTTGTVNRPGNVTIQGDGIDTSEIFCTTNAPVISTVGTSSSVISGGGVRDILLRAAGYTSANAHGIYEAWTNRSRHANVRIHGARYGMYASNVWQVAWDTIDVDGVGADQNYIGFYMAEVDPSNQNNAVRAVNCMAQGVVQYGFRLINFNGSKFTSCEAVDGVHGWYLGDPTSGTQQVRWGHFVNCLADTTSSHGWRIEKGAAAAARKVQLANCWAGNTGGDGFRISGSSHVALSNPMTESTVGAAVRFVQSTRCAVSGGDLENYDTATAGVGGVAVDDSQYIKVIGAELYTTSSAAKAFVESGTSDYNVAMGNTLHGGFTKVGTYSKVIRNMGVYGERSGSAVIGSTSTAVTVTHGMGYAPSLDDITLTLRDSMGSATKTWPSNANATTFDINVNTAPGVNITIGWAIDPLGQ